MTAPAVPRVVVQVEPLDAAAELLRLHAGRTDIGAIVSFVGLCRDEGGRLRALEIEAYPAMAEGELARIGGSAAGRWSLTAITVIHRFGIVVPGDQIVFVAAASPHRGEAFAAAEFVMDFLKTDAPFWKREHPTEGLAAGWIGARESDIARKKRW